MLILIEMTLELLGFKQSTLGETQIVCLLVDGGGLLQGGAHQSVHRGQVGHQGVDHPREEVNHGIRHRGPHHGYGQGKLHVVGDVKQELASSRPYQMTLVIEVHFH